MENMSSFDQIKINDFRPTYLQGSTSKTPSPCGDLVPGLGAEVRRDPLSHVNFMLSCRMPLIIVLRVGSRSSDVEGEGPGKSYCGMKDNDVLVFKVPSRMWWT